MTKRPVTNRILFLIALTLVMLNLQVGNVAADCPVAGILLASQAEVDAFPVNFPGCSEMPFDLRIVDADDGNNDITSLIALVGITSVFGNLEISRNPLLMQINGLNGISEVKGNLHVLTNSVLANVDGLTNLVSIGGNLEVGANPALTNINGFSQLDGSPSLTTVGGNALIVGNPVLLTVDGLSELGSVGGNLQVLSNDLLIDVDGLIRVISIGGGLQISGNGGGLPPPLNAPPRPREASRPIVSKNGKSFPVGGNVEISNNPSLKSLNGLNNLTYVSGNVEITANSGLLNLNGLGRLASVAGNFQVALNPALADLDQLSTLTHVAGNVEIFSNPLLTTVDGLSSLGSVGGNLQISANNSLIDVDGLLSIIAVGGGLRVSGNGGGVAPPLIPLRRPGELSKAASLPMVSKDGKSFSVGGNIEITFNPNLRSFNGLLNLSFVSGNVEITANSGLTTVNGLGRLASVAGNFQIGLNPELIDLDGLASLTHVAGNVEISSNAALVHVNRLSRLGDIGGGFFLTLNPSLMSVAGLSGIASVAGNLDISMNGVPKAAKLPGPAKSERLANPSPRSAVAAAQHSLSITGQRSVGGNLHIMRNASLTNFDGLSALILVSGSVEIGNNIGLANLDGLTGLTDVRGNCQIAFNQDLIHLNGLGSLTNVSGNLEIQSNPFLQQVDGLHSVASVGGNLHLTLNDSLTNVNGLIGIVTIGGGLDISMNGAPVPGKAASEFVRSQLQSSGTDATKNSILTSSIGGNLHLSRNPSLRDMSGLANLNAVGGNVEIVNNPGLVSVDGLMRLADVGGNFQVILNAALTDLDGLAALADVGGNLEVDNNQALVQLNGLSGLLRVGGNLQITLNEFLQNIDGLSSVVRIAGSLEIAINGGINGVPGGPPSNLTEPGNRLPSDTVGGNLQIRLNGRLRNFDGLSNLAEVRTNVQIANNPGLTNLDGLSRLVTVGGTLDITLNSTLSDIDGLSSLAEVWGNIEIHDNPHLMNISGLASPQGLANLTFVGGQLRVENNDALINVDGLLSLISVQGELRVLNNGILSSCCGLFPILQGNGVLGLVSITANLPGCNSEDEILFAGPCRLIDTRIIDTGQTACYDGVALLACPASGEPFFGQDGQYPGLPAGYRDNGDLTLSDRRTGLMWQKTPGVRMIWAQAVTNATSFDLAGYQDWRLPTIKELFSLVNFTGGFVSDDTDSVPFIDTTYFDFSFGDPLAGVDYRDAQYASITEAVSPAVGGAPAVFGVNFAEGFVKAFPRDVQSFFVRYVRGGEGYGRPALIENGDSTVTDVATGLMWTRDDSGHLGAGVAGDGKLDWQEALAWAEGLDLAGYTDWRLPNAKELLGLADYTRAPAITGGPAIDPIFETSFIIDEGGGLNYPYFWTGTTHLDGGSAGAAVYVAFGEALGFNPIGGGDFELVDLDGAGALRSDPKVPAQPGGGSEPYPVTRTYNFVRAVRDLMVVSEIFEDDFESGSTSAWSDTSSPNP